MTIKLLTEHHLEFLSLKGDCTGSSESTLVKMPHCWKSHVTAYFIHGMRGSRKFCQRGSNFDNVSFFFFFFFFFLV